MARIINTFYGFDCRLLQKINRYFDKKFLNLFFRTITHFGGARFTISAAFLLLISASTNHRMIAYSSALALAVSHIPVHFMKKLFPRKRPYLMVLGTKYPADPLQDHSFPSGHTTAIFSIIIPYILFIPHLSVILIPLGICVGISRVYLGLHYPSDVIAGGLLGTVTGILCFCLLCI